MRKKVDIIVSCYNEEDNVLPFYNETKKYLNDEKYHYNIVYVNDGSTDKTYENVVNLKEQVNKESNIDISIISFEKNFGHESAMCAGFDMSNANYLIFMDVDLQNPPSKIPEILKKFEEGADTVLLRRVKYNSASFMKKMFSKGYYLFSSIVLRNKNARDVSDFFAVDKNVAEKVRMNYRTTLRFVRSFVQAEAKSIRFVNYENGAINSGVSRYNFWKLSKLAITSELSRIKFLRDKYKETDDNKIYMVDKEKTFYC